MQRYRCLLCAKRIDSDKIGEKMDIFKIPRMEKEEYDRLIKENYVSWIAFKGDSHPYVAPFLYVFDGRNLFFLSTKYGRKIRYFNENPNVAVEIERFSADMACYMFVTLLGQLVGSLMAQKAKPFASNSLK